jgi:hypothetical protein
LRKWNEELRREKYRERVWVPKAWLNVEYLWWYVDGDDDGIEYQQKILRKFSAPTPSRSKIFLFLGGGNKWLIFWKCLPKVLPPIQRISVHEKGVKRPTKNDKK